MRTRTGDEDPLLRTALQLDWFHTTFCGVNTSPDVAAGSEEDIDKIQERTSKLFEEVIPCTGYFETSKIHQLRVHLKDQLLYCRNTRFSDTDTNEASYKGVKKAYLSTNKSMSQIGPQLLQVNVETEILDNATDGRSISAGQHELLLTQCAR